MLIKTIIKSAENSLEVLYEPIKVSNDRVKVFQKAIQNLKQSDPGLKDIIETLSVEIARATYQTGAEPGMRTNIADAVNPAWTGLKATLSGTAPKRILKDSGRGDNAIKIALRAALISESGLRGRFNGRTLRDKRGCWSSPDQRFRRFAIN